MIQMFKLNSIIGSGEYLTGEQPSCPIFLALGQASYSRFFLLRCMNISWQKYIFVTQQAVSQMYKSVLSSQEEKFDEVDDWLIYLVPHRQATWMCDGRTSRCSEVCFVLMSLSYI